MKETRMREILEELKTHLVEHIDDYLPFPEPFIGKGPIKAIVLGADPSTKNTLRFDMVFDLGNNKRYFKSIEKNLNAIGLSMDNVYIQNFCQNYFDHTTYENKKNWWRASGVWAYFIKEELEGKFDGNIPILATSEMIYKRLDPYTQKTPKYYYENPEILPQNASLYTSGRKVFPFYRHWRYNLERPEWKNYRKVLTEYFK
jgi:hypothetical protein